MWQANIYRIVVVWLWLLAVRPGGDVVVVWWLADLTGNRQPEFQCIFHEVIFQRMTMEVIYRFDPITGYLTYPQWKIHATQPISCCI